MSNESPETRSDLNHQEIDGGVEHSEGAERETMPTTSNNMGNFRITPIGFIGLIVCLTGCIGSFLFGSLLTILSWTIGGGVRGMELHEVGSVLLCLTIPLVIVSGYLLDFIDRENQNRKLR
ncbi:MAG: hypothetical protein IPO77_16485 [Acidobacteria bacterium]|nr:hypothetical protein [Acidobacteriota bacterium]